MSEISGSYAASGALEGAEEPFAVEVEKEVAIAGKRETGEDARVKLGVWRIAEDGARTAKAPAANLRTETLLSAEEASMI
jgi:hypothetical protein